MALPRGSAQKIKDDSKPKKRFESLGARAVARDVIAKLEKGEKVLYYPIIRAHGYSHTTAANPKNITERQSYKEEMESYTSRLEKHRTKILAAMERKDLDEEQYRTLADAQAKVTHDVQLLTGGKTENIGMEKDRETLKAIVAAIQIDKE